MIRASFSFPLIHFAAWAPVRATRDSQQHAAPRVAERCGHLSRPLSVSLLYRALSLTLASFSGLRCRFPCLISQNEFCEIRTAGFVRTARRRRRRWFTTILVSANRSVSHFRRCWEVIAHFRIGAWLVAVFGREKNDFPVCRKWSASVRGLIRDRVDVDACSSAIVFSRVKKWPRARSRYPRVFLLWHRFVEVKTIQSCEPFQVCARVVCREYALS